MINLVTINFVAIDAVSANFASLNLSDSNNNTIIMRLPRLHGDNTVH